MIPPHQEALRTALALMKHHDKSDYDGMALLLAPMKPAEIVELITALSAVGLTYLEELSKVTKFTKSQYLDGVIGFFARIPDA